MKFSHIQEFERAGIKMHKSNGGQFLSGEHADRFSDIKATLSERAFGQNAENSFGGWGSVNDELKFSDKDIQAYLEWDANYCANNNAEPRMKHFEDFAIRVLNASKVGTSWNPSSGKIIATSDTMPFTTFERWIRSGYHVHQFEGYKYDADKKLFIPRIQSPAEFQQDREKKMELESDLNRKLD